MNKSLALCLCLAMLGACALPAWATEVTDPTQPAAEYTGPAGSDVMLVVCLVLVVAGGIYLLVTFKKSGRR